ncbi:response regulator [Cellulophaga sp. HaHaR_3_176]|uniref:response regulator n=1 Tax=Cellulophaga sp. HaHaR_3_176 TaxID=1942464 RepID=UPI001C1FBD94|nr:response regulator [Cellulophaga sp. HaHaR_3_176]QWX83964.1 response regulator [Cellulophaga sp. HaHaR_3_176]
MKLKILLVDDDPVVQYLHKTVLSGCNYPAQEMFSNGRLALDYIIKEDSEDTVFLVLLDINMPIMNGWEFLDELSNTTIQSNVKVIVVTSSIDQSDKEKAGDCKNVFGFLEKPLLENDVNDLKFKDEEISFFFK